MDHKVLDFGTDSYDSCDYADFAHRAAEAVQHGDVSIGVVLCGSGNGVNMVANKYQNVRCALCWTAEIAMLGRAHNDANIIAIPARFVSEHQAIQMVQTFLETPFDGGRHKRRIDKIPIS